MKRPRRFPRILRGWRLLVAALVVVLCAAALWQFFSRERVSIRYQKKSNKDTVELVDATTFEKRWASRCPGPVGQAAFRDDGSEVAATWYIPNQFFGGKGGVKAWDAAGGTVVLDEREIDSVSGLAFVDDGQLLAGPYLFEPISAAK